MRYTRLKKGIVFTIVLSFILSPFFGFDVYHTVQAATVKVQKESMWCTHWVAKPMESKDGKIRLEQTGAQCLNIIYYKGKLYFKESDSSNRLIHTKSKKATTQYTGSNYNIISSNPNVVKLDISGNAYYLECPRTGTAVLTTKDKKGNVVNKTKITVTNPTYRIDFKALCKDVQNHKYTGADIFYIGTYLKHNGKRLTKKQQERAIKYGDNLTASANKTICGRTYFEGFFAFEPHRYLGKQTGRINNKKDLNEQRRLNIRLYVGYTPEKTEIATKPEDGSWNVFYKGETAKVPFSLKNQTAEKLYAAENEGYCCYDEFIKTEPNNVEAHRSDTKGTVDYYKYKFFKTDKPCIDRVIVKDTTYKNVLSDFYVMVLPISKEGETYYSTVNEVGYRGWYFPNSIRTDIFKKQTDVQMNITVGDMVYSSTNKDNTLNDFLYKYRNKTFDEFSNKENGWNVTVVEDGVTYNNQDNTLWVLAEKYGYYKDKFFYDFRDEEITVFYNMAIEKGWKVTIQKGNEYYSTENIDNTLNDFGRKYNLEVDTVNQSILAHKGVQLPNDLKFSYEVIYKDRQLFKIDCHV